MESDMDRWIQDRDRLSKQLEKCQMKYDNATVLQCPFRHGVLTRQMEEFNASISSVHTSVVWLFGDLINYFKFLDYKKSQNWP